MANRLPALLTQASPESEKSAMTASPDQRPDACFHDRMFHRPHGRFETPAPTEGGVAALAPSPSTSR